MEKTKAQWSTPILTVYGDIATITQQMKHKSWGGGDDVLVADQSILSNAS